jgi:hypothetical protein
MGSVNIFQISQSFTIHGLWPTIKKTGTKFGDFNERYLTNIRDDLDNYWPPQS